MAKAGSGAVCMRRLQPCDCANRGPSSLLRRCREATTLASTQLMALAPPSGSGVAFFDVALGLHEVTLRDGSGAVIDVRDVVILPDDATEVTFILDRQVPTSTVGPNLPTATVVPPTAVPTATTTSMVVSGLPSTGSGAPGSPLVPLLLLLGAIVLGSGSVLLNRRPDR